VNRYQCPVCGYEKVEISDNTRNTTYGICSSCGNQCGCDYDLDSTQEQFLRLRKDWVLTTGARWWGSEFDQPVDWSPYAQMKRAGFIYPLIPTLLAFHHLGLIDDKYAQDWADRNIESELDDFDGLLTISMHGMPKGSKLHDYEFPTRRKFNFSEEFALRVQRLEPSNVNESRELMKWIANESMSLDINLPEVAFGYQIDHYIDYNEGVDPFEYFLAEFDEFKKSTLKLNNELWDEIK